MGFYVEQTGGEVDPRSARLSRSRGGGDEMEEMQKLFEQYMGGEDVEGGEGEEEINWEEMWNTVMGEEEYGEGEQQQGSQYPTLFGSPMRPGGIKYPSSPGIHYY